MKKVLMLALMACISVSVVCATETPQMQSQQMAQKAAEMRMQRANAFERRLGLTDEQKIKAREIRLKGHRELRPVIEEIMKKKQEAKMVKMSRIAVEVQEERLQAIEAELKVLEKKSNAIKKQNLKEFESILTRGQKKALKQMKKEGRQKYHAEHPVQRPMLPPGVQLPVKK